jgi:tRNA pseudouridine55 synthase
MRGGERKNSAAQERERGLDGIIVLNKPQGMTSHDAVMLVRRLTGVRKVGHTGTLDPMAGGVLPVCVGKATRMAEFISPGPSGRRTGAPDAKEYDCEMRLGVTTDTLDVWGTVTGGESAPGVTAEVTRERILKVMDSLAGYVMQTPPAYSAIKYKGRKLYEYARDGEDIPVEALRPRRVHIGAIRVTEIAFDRDSGAAEDGLPSGAGFGTVKFSVTCSGGTYVRSIVRDAGEALRCGAAMSALTRTRSGVFTMADARSTGELEAAAEDGRMGGMTLPMDSAISFMPTLEVGDADRSRFVNGMKVSARGFAVEGAAEADGAGDAPEPFYIRVYGGGGFLGVGSYSDGIVKPCKVVATA